MASRRAVTLVELLATMSILGTLSALILPAVQSARESSRANTCRNNLHQVGVALVNYESAQRHFPMGAEGRYDRSLSPVTMFGLSWWAGALPYLEESSVVEQLDRSGANTGWVQLNAHNGALVDGFAPTIMFCPSSPLERFLAVSSYRLSAPSYVGISGATSHDGFPETRVSPCCRSDGEISAGGVLVPNTVIHVKQITDGLSRTMLVGEQSDFARAATGETRRIDGGYPNGWICGTNSLGIPPEYTTSFSPSYNLATLRYTLNERRYELPGIYIDRGADNPLLSAHPGIVHVLYCDGSVHALADSMEIGLLKTIATRDDHE